MLLNSLNKRRLTELFEALAKTLKDDQYTQQGKPAFPLKAEGRQQKGDGAK